MRIVSILTALMVVVTLYLVVLERPALLALSQGDWRALGDTGAAHVVRGALGAEPHDAGPPAVAVGEPPADADADDAAPAPEEAERSVAVVAMRVAAQPIDQAVVVRGRTEAARQVEVRAETSGRVISEPRRRGAFVTAGEVLCELSPATRAAALAEAEARLEAARIDARAAEQLSQGGFASDTRAASARAALQGAEAAVAAAREELARLEVRAPFDGLMETDAAELGSLLQPGALCATVIQLDPIRLVGFVPEISVDAVEVGALAGARLSSGREVVGQVSFIARAADPATRTFRVEITVPNSDLAIRDGQTADIGIRARGTEAHLVPGSALTLDDAGRLGLRTIDAESRARFVPVSIVRDTARGLWLTGLDATADVIVVGQEFVTDGVKVTPSFRDAPDGADAAGGLFDALEGAAAEAEADAAAGAGQ